jgi:molecular chaperone GrpE
MQNQDHTEKEESPINDSDIKETDIKAEDKPETDEKTEQTKIVELEAKATELNDKYLRLYSEFDNYRKRTNKERAEIIKTASEEVFKAILPVIDDLDRAVKANEKAEDITAIKEGIQLIYNKLKNTAQQKGLTPFDSIGEVFNPDIMEAITHIPATDDTQKGKVIDEVEKGYKLGDKVIRFAKVVIAQ